MTSVSTAICAWQLSGAGPVEQTQIYFAKDLAKLSMEVL